MNALAPIALVLSSTLLFVLMFYIELDGNMQKINFVVITGLVPSLAFYAILTYIANTAMSPTSSAFITGESNIEPSLLVLFTVIPIPSIMALLYPLVGNHAFWAGCALGGLVSFSGIYNLTSLVKIISSDLAPSSSGSTSNGTTGTINTTGKRVTRSVVTGRSLRAALRNVE